MGEDREAVKQAQLRPLRNQLVEADQQSLMAPALRELKDADPSASAAWGAASYSES
jgi:hypothetical protein